MSWARVSGAGFPRDGVKSGFVAIRYKQRNAFAREGKRDAPSNAGRSAGHQRALAPQVLHCEPWCEPWSRSPIKAQILPRCPYRDGKHPPRHAEQSTNSAAVCGFQLRQRGRQGKHTLDRCLNGGRPCWCRLDRASWSSWIKFLCCEFFMLIPFGDGGFGGPDGFGHGQVWIGCAWRDDG